MGYFFTVQVFGWLDKILIADLPETIPFLSAQIALLSRFFQVFIVLDIYNIDDIAALMMQVTSTII